MNTTTQRLVEQYVPLANKLAFQRKKTLPKRVDIDELKSAAYLGLVEAASRYDARVGAFSTFAYPRIFGAIHDYLREQGWTKKGDHRKIFSLDDSYEDGTPVHDIADSRVESRTDECFDVITMNMDNQAKSVLRHYFIDDYSLKEVGEKFGVSESRVCQLVKKYKQELRSEWNESDLRLELAA